MSLLMDALRKAELEKKEAAKRHDRTGDLEKDDAVEEQQAGSDSQPQIGETTSEQAIRRLDPTQVRSREEIFAATRELKLEPIDLIERNEKSDTQEQEIAPQETGQEVDDTILMPQFEPDQRFDETIDVASLENLDLTIAPAAEGEQESDSTSNLNEMALDLDLDIPGLYDETIQGEPFNPSELERVFDETLPGVSALELAKDLGEESQPTPVAAQTVFTATATANGARSLKWPVIIGLTVVVIVAFSIVVFQSVTPLVRQIPTQQLAGELDLQKSPITQDLLLGEPQSGVLTGQVSDIEQESAVDQLDQSTVEDADAIVAEGSVETIQLSEEMVDEAEEIAADAGSTSRPASPESIEIEPGLIKISRSKAPDERGLIINQAYLAFKNGDYADARSGYEEVLKLFPDNRDAMLGLGAIAMKEGNLTKVYEIYSQLLKINPMDHVANAVLITLDNKSDLVSKESALKILLKDTPDDAFLYFSLGNIYARQLRWAEAQQAYFDAYRNNSANPDYALNLAISLDHMGQKQAALDYYNTALKLSDEQSAGFDSANILARIQSLTALNSN